jgi:hypothetical protein
LRQIFVQQWNEGKAEGGLLALYKEARSQISSSTRVLPPDPEDTRDAIYKKACRDSDLNRLSTKKLTYPPNFFQNVNAQTRVSSTRINAIKAAIVNPQYSGNNVKLMKLMLERLKADWLGKTFSQVVEERILSSKNNPEIKNINAMADRFLTGVFKEFKNLSGVTQTHLRQVVIRILACRLQVYFGI